MILGIDPGLENTGWGVVDGEKLVDCGVILTNKKESSVDRLGKIYNELEKIIKKFKVEEMAIETLFFAKNAKSVMKVSEAIGVVKICGKKNGLEVTGYTPLQVKQALVGYGRAEKEQVEIMVREALGLNDLITPSHAADAVAVALTHGFTMKH
ncbi:MAG: crossover junction endodeoxyribonuclease RuvC [Candidatus Shapirobacteria bacterium]